MRAVIANGTTLLFVSHNLKSVTEICPRAILLKHGRILSQGDTDSVIREYHLSEQNAGDDDGPKAVTINYVRVRDESGEQSTFESGQTIWVDIEITAQQAVEKAAVVIWFVDQTDYEIFNTSTERLGLPALNLQPGQSYRCTYELKLNVAHGTFGLCVAVH